MPQMLEMRTSERRSLKKCAQQWYWSTVEGLAPTRAANPLWFGSAVHEGLAKWYLKGSLRGPHPTETFLAELDGQRVMLVTNEDEEKQYVDARELGVDMLNRYVQEYGRDDSWDVISTETPFRVLVPRPKQMVFGHELPAQKKWLRYVGTWDGVYRDLETGLIWLMEHKTAASIRIDHLPLDDQAGSYWAFATSVLRQRGVLGPDEVIEGIMYNFLRKTMTDTRPVNPETGLRTNKPNKQHFLDALDPFYELTGKETLATLEELVQEVNSGAVGDPNVLPDGKLVVFGEPSANQPAAFFERTPVYRSSSERKTMVRRIQDEALFSEAYRKGWLPITKAPDKQMCAFCDFKRMCELDEQGDQQAVEEFKESQYIKRNPYEDHVKKSAE